MKYSVVSPAPIIEMVELRGMARLSSRSEETQESSYTAVRISTEELETIDIGELQAANGEEPQAASPAEAMLENGGQAEEKTLSVCQRMCSYVRQNPKTAIGMGIGLALAGAVAIGGGIYATLPNSADVPAPAPTDLCTTGQLFLLEHSPSTTASIKALGKNKNKNEIVLASAPQGIERCHYRSDFQINPNITLFGTMRDENTKTDRKTNALSFDERMGAIKVSFMSGKNGISFEGSCDIPDGFSKKCDEIKLSKSELRKNNIIK